MPRQHWPQVLLSLFCAIWAFLMVQSMVTKEFLFGVEDIPNYYQVFYQISVFIVAKHLIRLLFVRFYPFHSIGEPMETHGLATSFTLQQAALLLAIISIQGLSPIGINVILGQIHIITATGWIFFRQLLEVSKVHAFGGHLSGI